MEGNAPNPGDSTKAKLGGFWDCLKRTPFALWRFLTRAPIAFWNFLSRTLPAPKHFDAFFVLIGMILLVLFCIIVHHFGIHDNSSNWGERTANTLAAFVQLKQDTPSATVLHGLNVATCIYAYYFYLTRSQSLGSVFMLIALLTFAALSTLSFAVGYQLGLPSPFMISNPTPAIREEISIAWEYVYTFLMTTFFASADLIKSHNSTDARTKALLTFSSMYLSWPALATLVMAAILYIFYIDRGCLPALGLVFGLTARGSIEPNPDTAYLAGVGAVVLFLTNLILALVSMPMYASKLHISHSSDSNGNA